MKPKNTGIQMTDKALLFINGIPPRELPQIDGYDVVACSDGAFEYLKEKGFPLNKLDFISGDFDSHSGEDASIEDGIFIHTPDQEKTDFQKSLEIIMEKGCKTVDVYGGSGGEMDHFLGNLTVAYLFKDDMNITFFDDHSHYYFAPKKLVLNDVKSRLISLYPFPVAKNITTTGLNWPLENENLDITTRIGTRNFAKEEQISIEFEVGDLIIFVGNKDSDNFNGILK